VETGKANIELTRFKVLADYLVAPRESLILGRKPKNDAKDRRILKKYFRLSGRDCSCGRPLLSKALLCGDCKELVSGQLCECGRKVHSSWAFCHKCVEKMSEQEKEARLGRCVCGNPKPFSERTCRDCVPRVGRSSLDPVDMKKLYVKLKDYVAVGKELECSPELVRRVVKRG
jgi:hypothetical protein